MMFNQYIRKVALGLVAGLVLVTGALASGGGPAWDKAPDKSTDQAALQNGAKLFVNYCLNCHSAAFMRYTRLTDLGLTEQQIKDNLVPTGAKLGETMKAAVDAKQGATFFGAAPPDLSVITRSRSGDGGTGSDYLYTYMRTFYQDSSKPTGWNNLAFPNVAMPHVLWEMQGIRRANFETVKEHGADVHKFKSWEQVTPGTMTEAQYDQAVGDLVAYLSWMAEPVQNTRKRIGLGVLIFLAGMIFLTWKLNAAYWKDIK
jgi:ubiquinol-cytochrome c reductase cytochrome c1 subunit